MLNSKLAIQLQSKRPLAILQYAKDKFLFNLQAIASDEQFSRKMQKFAYKKNLNEVAFKKRADDDEADEGDIADMLEQIMSSMAVPYVTPNGTAVFQIEGVIGKNLSVMERAIGCCDINDLQAKLKEWAADSAVKRVVLKINSGGGTTTGLEETAKMIFNYKKPTASFTDEDMGSAAYWLGSQCDRVVVTPSSTIGSVGIYVSFVDESKKFKEDGRNVVVIKSGDFKGAGIEGVPLTQLQGDWIQDEVLDLHAIFKNTIKRSRSLVKEEEMQGQTFTGLKSAERNLVTGLADCWDDFIKQFDDTGEDIIPNIINRGNANATQPTIVRQSPTRKVR
jgi:ClpP class serine protease